MSGYLQNLNKAVMAFSEHDRIAEHPKAHYGLNMAYLTLRGEIAAIEQDKRKRRKQQLKELFFKDYIKHDEELRQVDMAFMDTQF
ncbi:hypothetical protein WA026_009148 [Henosepilachna vigintioctopunctata]|uniref:Uncharacterized protein n=1 Tax=Henosepilachna vigintioctopunctata TaxID=420089 RepID=A0AAW1UUZ5_9CUCU